MYRKRNGSLGFSFTKFANAAVPNFFADESTSMTTQMHPMRRDMLYSHQLASSNFYTLDDRSCYVAGIVDTERVSKTLYKALQKAEILEADGKVNTYKIGARFMHQIAMLNTVRQRECINMLFWWEEECHRFKKLEDENRELSTMITEAELHAADDRDDTARKEMVDQLKFARERVRMKIRQRPTQRRHDTEADTDNILESFRGRAHSAPMLSSRRHEDMQMPRDELPGYETVAAR